MASTRRSTRTSSRTNFKAINRRARVLVRRHRCLTGPPPAGTSRLDVQGRDGRGRARVRPLQRQHDVLRPRLPHRVRPAREQLRHVDPSAPCRSRRQCSIDQLVLLQPRQRAGRRPDRRRDEGLRLLRPAAARGRRTSGGASGLYKNGEAVRAEDRSQADPGRLLRAGAPRGDAAPDGDGRATVAKEAS